jgi:ankyrin repeat protein
MGSSAQCGLYPLPGDAELYQACGDGDVGKARTALRCGANPNAHRFLHQGGPLGLAAIGGHTDLVRLLVRAGAYVNQPYGTWHYKPPLVWAAMDGHLETVRVLLDAGADIHAESCENETALKLAAEYNHPAVVKLLKQRGAEH